VSRQEDPDPYRIVLDESSFDFRDLTDAAVEEHLRKFNDTMLRVCDEARMRVPLPSGLYNVACRDGLEFFEFLFTRGKTAVDRDVLELCRQILQKLPDWGDETREYLDEVRIGGEAGLVLVESVAYALVSKLRGHSVACLVFPGSGRRGSLDVAGGDGTAQVFFFAGRDELPTFWRAIFRAEDVREPDFMEIARHAFPDLVFHEDLSFGKFADPYLELRDRVVAVLAILNDHFLAAHRESRGVRDQVQARLRAHGVKASPESGRTHSQNAKIAQRDRDHNEKTVRCDWHAKLDWNRNRIHFAPLPAPDDGKILIGIFADHLKT
jgi:hypothetical protein